jgi:hypothetical protein
MLQRLNKDGIGDHIIMGSVCFIVQIIPPDSLKIKLIAIDFYL